MGVLDIFARLGKKQESLSVPGITGVGNRLFRVDSTAMENSAFWSCVTLLCQKYATIPLIPHVDGSYKAMGRNRLLSTVLDRPNRWMNHYDFMYVMGFNFEVHGQAIAILEKSTNGKVINMYPVSPTTMTAHWTDNGELRYRCNTNGMDYAREDLLIINNTPAGYDTFLSPMQYAAGDIALANQSKNLQSEYYSGGSVIGRVIKVNPQMYEKQREQLRAVFDSATGFRNIVLPDSVQIEPIKVEGEDIGKLIQAQTWDVMEVARRFHVPKAYLGDTSGGYGTQEQQALQLVTECLQPRCKAWEIAFNQDVCGDTEYVKFELQGLMRGDHSARQAWYTAMLTHGVMSVNEVRELEDMEPIGPEGDVHYFQAGFASLKDIQNGAFTKNGGSQEPKEADEGLRLVALALEQSLRKKDILIAKVALHTVAKNMGESDGEWLDSYFKGLLRRWESMDARNEAFRFINAVLVHRCTENGIGYSLDGKKPVDGYFEENGNKFRNPPARPGDERIITVEDRE